MKFIDTFGVGSTAQSVNISRELLGSDAKWVFVSPILAKKKYGVFGFNPLNTAVFCHVPGTALTVFIAYCAPAIELNVMLVAVLLAIVGAVGADGPSAFVTAEVGTDVTLPLQLAAVTVTVIIAPISACNKV